METEILKGKSDGELLTILAIGLVLFFSITVIFNSNNVYALIIMSIIATGIIYWMLGDLYHYSFYEDKIEINYPFRKKKNQVILKEQIKFARYEELSKVTKLTIYYKVNNVKKKSIIRLQHSFKYIYDSNLYKILFRINEWKIKLELNTSSKELKSIIKNNFTQ
jgi:hypothetical protein